MPFHWWPMFYQNFGGKIKTWLKLEFNQWKGIPQKKKKKNWGYKVYLIGPWRSDVRQVLFAVIVWSVYWPDSCRQVQDVLSKPSTFPTRVRRSSPGTDITCSAWRESYRSDTQDNFSIYRTAAQSPKSEGQTNGNWALGHWGCTLNSEPIGGTQI